MKDRGVLTESMFYVLMSFLRSEMCGIEITEFVARKTHGRLGQLHDTGVYETYDHDSSCG